MTEEMTDREIREHIAVKVMGWELLKSRLTVPQRGEHGYYERPFDPLTSDADCMAAWDQFCKAPRYVIMGTTWREREWLIKAMPGAIKVRHTDRRRAICLCMVAATGGQGGEPLHQ